MKPTDLPSTFYRVSVKALIFDEKQRLLVGYMDSDDSKGWEMPGGGWEHGESLENCLKRELEEEFSAEIQRVGEVRFVYENTTVRGYPKINVCVKVELKSTDVKANEMSDARYVTKDELLSLDFAADEAAIKEFADQIWPE